jgi:hypothetical protein
MLTCRSATPKSRSTEQAGFTVVSCDGDEHHFGVASARERDKWIEKIGSIICGKDVEVHDETVCGSKELLALVEVGRALSVSAVFVGPSARWRGGEKSCSVATHTASLY